MKPKPIRHNPAAGLHLLLRSPSPEMAQILGFAPRLYRFSRDALHAWFRSLNFPKGATAWMPAFHCGMEVRAAVDAGFSPRFYRIRQDLTIDKEDLAAGLRQHSGSVLLIHYFGFPQPDSAGIAALCRQHGVPLVEDCSHALFSSSQDGLLGTLGDAATFSVYKTLGTSDGGALRVANGAVASPEPRSRPLIAWADHWHEIQRHRRDAPGSPEAMATTFASRVVTARERIFDQPWSYERGISRLSHALISRMNPDHVRERRRRNFQRLHQMLQGISGYCPLYSELPQGTCPLYLPIFAQNPVSLLLHMQAERIEAFIFGMFRHPSMEEALFPECRRLRNEILCLPVHQDLDDSDLERIAELLRRLTFV